MNQHGRPSASIGSTEQETVVLILALCCRGLGGQANPISEHCGMDRIEHRTSLQAVALRDVEYSLNKQPAMFGLSTVESSAPDEWQVVTQVGTYAITSAALSLIESRPRPPVGGFACHSKHNRPSSLPIQLRYQRISAKHEH
jgi:hypothetical protein